MLRSSALNARLSKHALPNAGRFPLRQFVLGAIAFLGICAPALSQTVGLPQELLENSSRRVQGEQITFCIDDNTVAAAFDRKVSQAIADALLLKAAFVPAPSGFALDAAGYMDELALAMTNTCDVAPGFSHQPASTFPDWAVLTRAYAEVPFVFVVKQDAAFETLNDIPRTATIGTALGSIAESNFNAYNFQQPKDQQWRRLPYADPKLMLKRLMDDTLAGMLLWGPSLKLATDGAALDTLGLKIIPSDPVPATSVMMGALVSSRDAFLRSQVDQAIGSLIADGTIARLLEEEGIHGKPGPQ